MQSFYVSQRLQLNVINETIPIEHYLRQPQRLVGAITDSSRVEQLNPSRFRLRLRSLQFMMLQFQPVAELEIWAQDNGTIHLKSVRCEVEGAEFLQDSLSLQLAGRLSPQRMGSATELVGQADLNVEVDVPAPLKLVPAAVLDRTGTAFLNGILLTIKNRLERQLVRDYRRWATAKSSALIPAANRPMSHSAI
ncbi:MAG: DUF1997 domain-containing protein [Synechococcus sp.]